MKNEEIENYDDMDLSDDTGGKICSFAKIWLVISMVVSIIVGVIGVISFIGNGAFTLLLIAISLGVGSYLIYLLLLGFGEMVQNTWDIYETNQAILEHLKSQKTEEK